MAFTRHTHYASRLIFSLCNKKAFHLGKAFMNRNRFMAALDMAKLLLNK
jgi:hypothetical protein